jgi:hypothetical protein
MLMRIIQNGPEIKKNEQNSYLYHIHTHKNNPLKINLTMKSNK